VDTLTAAAVATIAAQYLAYWTFTVAISVDSVNEVIITAPVYGILPVPVVDNPPASGGLQVGIQSYGLFIEGSRITVPIGQTLKAIAYTPGKMASYVISETYTA
jgi:hypothetical protein